MTPTHRKRLLRLLLLTGGFMAALGIAWAWYYVSPRQFPTSYSFRPTNHIVNYYYKAEPVGAEAAQILATTNLFNGTFLGPQAERYTVFVGTWDNSDAKQTAVVSHTPDICWVAEGWTPVTVGHPDKLELDFNGVKVPFEVRTFRPPGGGHLELTVWCTLISGQIFSESDRFELGPDAPDNASQRTDAAGRHLLRSNLIHAIWARVPGNGSKQFVRFSTELNGDWHAAFDNLRRFGRRWLELQVTHSQPDAH